MEAIAHRLLTWGYVVEPVLALVAEKGSCLCWMLALGNELELAIKHPVSVLVHVVREVFDVNWTCW